MGWFPCVKRYFTPGPSDYIQILTLCVENNYIPNGHVTFVAMCVLRVRYHIGLIVCCLKKSLSYKDDVFIISVMNVRLLITLF